MADFRDDFLMEVANETLIFVVEMKHEIPQVHRALEVDVIAVEIIVQVFPEFQLRHGLHVAPMLLADGIGPLLELFSAP